VQEAIALANDLDVESEGIALSRLSVLYGDTMCLKTAALAYAVKVMPPLLMLKD
jgi:hypothetical protein